MAACLFLGSPRMTRSEILKSLFVYQCFLIKTLLLCLLHTNRCMIRLSSGIYWSDGRGVFALIGCRLMTRPGENQIFSYRYFKYLLGVHEAFGEHLSRHISWINVIIVCVFIFLYTVYLYLLHCDKTEVDMTYYVWDLKADSITFRQRQTSGYILHLVFMLSYSDWLQLYIYSKWKWYQ